MEQSFPQAVETLEPAGMGPPTIQYATASPGASAALQVCTWLLFVGSVAGALWTLIVLVGARVVQPIGYVILLLMLSDFIGCAVAGMIVVIGRRSENWRKARGWLVYAVTMSECLTLALWATLVTVGQPLTMILMALSLIVVAPAFWLPWVMLTLMKGANARWFRTITAGVWAVALAVALLLGHRQ